MDKGDTVNVEKPIGSGEEGCLPVLPESSSTVRDNERIQHEQEEKRARLVFKYLREKKPLPSKTRQRWIVSVVSRVEESVSFQCRFVRDHGSCWLGFCSKRPATPISPEILWCECMIMDLEPH